MNKGIWGLLLVSVSTLSVNAGASLGDADAINPTGVEAITATASNQAMLGLNLDTVYEVTTALKSVSVLESYDDEGRVVAGPSVKNFTPEYDFKVMRINSEEQTAIIDLGSGVDDQGQVSSEPNILKVSLADVVALKGHAIDFDSEEAFNPIAQTAEARRGGGRARGHHSGRTTWCLRNVVNYAGGPHVEVAAMAYPLYLAEGWRPVGFDWQRAATNTVCLFNGGRWCTTKVHMRCGHAAVKLANGMWLADQVRPFPYPRTDWQARGYNFQGCVHR